MSERKWQIEGLRFTAFPGKPQIPQENAWETLTGKPPAGRQANPQEWLVHESGQFEIGTLVYEANPTRIDWRYLPQSTGDGIPNLGEFPEGAAQFLRSVKEWLKCAPGLKRVGYGPVLVLPVSNQEEGNAVLNRILPEIKIEQDCRDFLYQANRRKKSRHIEGLTLNHLTEWAVRTFAYAPMPVQQNDITPRQQAPTDACRLKLDVNTDYEFTGMFPKTELGKLFDELSELAVETAKKIGIDNP